MANVSTFNTILASQIFKALEPGEKREVGFDEVGGTMGDFVRTAVEQGLEIVETTDYAATFRKPESAIHSSMERFIRGAGAYMYLDVRDEGVWFDGQRQFQMAVESYMCVDDEHEDEWDYEGMFADALTEAYDGWLLPANTDIDAVISAHHPNPTHSTDAPMKDVILSYSELLAVKQENADLRDENKALKAQAASLRRQLASYEDATHTLMALINNE